MKPSFNHQNATRSEPPSEIDVRLMYDSMKHENRNHFLQFLYGRFPAEKVEEATIRYYIGYSDHHGGGTTVFWQIDRNLHVRAGKLMHYNPNTGKRNKELHPT